MRRVLGFVTLGFATLFLGLTATAWGADVTELVNKLKDKDPEVRRNAVQDLIKAGADAKEAAPALAAALKDPDAFVRRYAAQALGAIGADPKIAVPGLTAMLTDAKERKEAQILAVISLAKFGPDGVASLVSVVRDPNLDSSVRHKIVEKLGDLGKEARPAVGALLDEYIGKNMPKGRAPLAQEDRKDVIEAIEKIVTAEDKAAIAILSEEFAAKNLPKGRNPLGGQERRDMLGVLTKIATADDKPFMTALETVANDDKLKDDDQLKKAAKDTLKKIMEKK